RVMTHAPPLVKRAARLAPVAARKSNLYPNRDVSAGAPQANYVRSLQPPHTTSGISARAHHWCGYEVGPMLSTPQRDDPSEPIDPGVKHFVVGCLRYDGRRRFFQQYTDRLGAEDVARRLRHLVVKQRQSMCRR